MAKRRASMTEEEKARQREKDRLRKSAKKVPAPENWRTLPRKWKKPPTPYTEPEKNRLYQENRRLRRSEAEAEYERIEKLLMMRNARAKRSDEERIEQNETAKNDMQLEPILPFESRRKSKGHKEEYLWWKFWKQGDEYKAILRTKLPEFGAKFDMWDSGSQNPYKIDEEKEEEWNGMSHCEQRYERNKLRRKLIKEKLNQPIDMPDIELSEYEKLREQNIARQKAEFQKYMLELNPNDLNG